jgi:hypothetical protein
MGKKFTFPRKLFPALGLLLVLSALGTAPARAENPLVANIGWSTTSSSGPWSTASSITVNPGETIYFHALNSSGGDASTQDLDCPASLPKVYDTANYSWDWNYVWGGSNSYEASGVSASKYYNHAGTRVVQLKVDDTDGAGKVNDLVQTDTVIVCVRLTMEWDSMDGGGGYTAAQHQISETNLASAWSNPGYTLLIAPNHNTNCTYHEYLLDDLGSEAAVINYLDSYLSEQYSSKNCLLYLFGAHRWQSSGTQLYGYNPDGYFAMVFTFATGSNLSNADKTEVELHENACHSSIVGAIGHCSNATCPCQDLGYTTGSSSFCDDCEQKLEDWIQLCSSN